MSKRIILSVLCLIFLLCGCGAKIPADSGKKSVVVTVFPEYDFVRAVAGDRVNIKLLIDPGTEVHSFDPAPSDVAAVENSDLFIMIGGESDVWAERILADNKKINTLSMMNFAELLTEDGEDEYDEHIWTSPTNAQQMVAAVSDALIKIDADNAEFYRKNADSYIGEIEKVKGEIRAAVEKSENKFILVADRFPFKYFATEFGIDYAAAFGGCAASTDISIKTMARLISETEEHGCTAAYYVEMSNREIANALFEQTGVKLLELQSAHNVTLDDFKSGKTYVDIMRQNAAALEEGMK